MLKKLFETIKDKYLTWLTGKPKEEREWIEWYETTVHYKARSVEDMFKNFKHVIRVEPNTFFNRSDPCWFIPCEDALQYFWPQRVLGDNAVWRLERVIPSVNSVTGKIEYTFGFIGEDMVFVATNKHHDAIMIALKWGA